VGIFGSREADLWTGFASLEYLTGHELYAGRSIQLLLVPKEGHEASLDDWLERDVASEQTRVQTYTKRLRMYRQDLLLLFLICAVPEGIVAVVAALALAVLSYTLYAQRRQEFGSLHAIGYDRRWLVWRTLAETACVVALAWLLGAIASGAGLSTIQFALFAPRGLRLNFWNPVPWLLTLPLPLAVIAVAAGLVVRMLSRLDPVSIIERRS
jgi:hypothetical protein